MGAAMHASLRLAFALAFAALATGCALLTDGALRLAYDIRDSAKELRASRQESLEVLHYPCRIPDGVDGPYQITLQASKGTTGSGALIVSAIQDPASPTAPRYATSYHLQFIQVPKELSIRKGWNEPTYITLRKVGDHIEAVSIR